MYSQQDELDLYTAYSITILFPPRLTSEFVVSTVQNFPMQLPENGEIVSNKVVFAHNDFSCHWHMVDDFDWVGEKYTNGVTDVKVWGTFKRALF